VVVRHGRRRGRRLLGLIEFSDFGGPVLDVIGFFSNSNSMSNSALVELREENPKTSQENPIRVLLRGSMSALSFPKLPAIAAIAAMGTDVKDLSMGKEGKVFLFDFHFY
jgi:hypothetical protein